MINIISTLDTLPVWAPVLLVLLVLWSTVWKGLALWKSARLSHKKWFIILLVVNTVGILEIIYIYFVAKKYSVETVEGK
ncbi:MAG: hypothetical protein A3H52_02070 [Candidatus Zambryskibacteria bacterium RIFCSPLOWO2_02_FULL_39_26]|uniref:DUF5652 domain-containing protein n=1 Tax=Candidatus Zambryskibacteria bacterium RIFCSPLOWO2_12_FULL_39_23 TaxID=1802776 RepID=A0A1G2URN1_9BACT|nr:MAG: hypothetical protein A2W51_02630 [Candidatus Zambryskibacteria bacterium RIFCSPHIGHO2_02_39_10]OHB09732.1 MAG: hypothetical protein A3H52_02070 [Candidatus Zambryskibacteria bacterium RIFCSPLOWO2_02_FULL_39_26]OHB12047.1 MAG: hypothetical protein A3G99_03030 [Candidatus Zambryskibacteria bacterium RIFCSPLOWO2_12_FULL_39_23]